MKLFFSKLAGTTLSADDRGTIVVFLLAWIIGATATRLYHYERNITLTKQLQRFLFFCVLFLALFLAGNAIFFITSKFTPQALAAFFLIVAVLKALALGVLFKLRRNSTLFQENILVFESKTGKSFAEGIKGLKRTGYKLKLLEKHFFEESSFDKLLKIISEENISKIFVPVEVIFKKSKEHLRELNWSKEVKLKLIADYNAPFIGSKARYYGLTQVMTFNTSPLDSEGKALLKRTFDIIFSLFIILFFLSWLVPIMAVILRIDSKGPLFFIQKRPGKHGEPFKCFKFRSMTVNTSTEKSASRDDERITRMGKFIRKTSIDELPQFFNVFLGDMSVVGPRPNLSSQNELFSQIFEEYSKRMYLKPGITGLAQVSGARGGIEKHIEMKHRVKYDIFYIRNWSFALDIKIIIRTALNVFKGEDKAY